jgi:hypothetical protein
MITTNLTGNMGNNLYQLISSKCIALDLGYEWGVNPSPSHDYHNGANQMYFMDVDFGKPPEGGFDEVCEKWTFLDHVDRVNITRFDPALYAIKDGTRILGHNRAHGPLLQSKKYFAHRREEILTWMQTKPEYVEQYNKILADLEIDLNEVCVINVRGGEYRTIPACLLQPSYWKMAMERALEGRPSLKFVVVSDDPQYASSLFPGLKVLPRDIGLNFYAVRTAKKRIIANSTFSWWAAWLGDWPIDGFTIAPKYWARWNVSDGYWSTGDCWTQRFIYLDRNGVLTDGLKCEEEGEQYYKDRGL